MSRNLTEMQEAFISAFVEGKNGTDAAREAGYSDPKVAASKLKKDLAAEIRKATDERFTREAPRVMAEMKKIIYEGSNESAKARMIADWLDRAGYKPVDKHEDVTEQMSLDELMTQMKTTYGDDRIVDLVVHGRQSQYYDTVLSALQADEPANTDDPDSPHSKRERELMEERRRINLAKRH